MGRFINGQHVSWSTSLGPNERLGEEDEMEFNRLAKQIDDEKSSQKNLDADLNDLADKLEEYNRCREVVVQMVEQIVKKYPNRDIYSDRIDKLTGSSPAIAKILEYYIKKFSS